jgi:hypothetical protein
MKIPRMIPKKTPKMDKERQIEDIFWVGLGEWGDKVSPNSK